MSAKIKPHRFNSARIFITKKYNKIIWTNGNVNNIGLYDIQNSQIGHFQSSTCKYSLSQLRQWKASVLDIGITARGLQGWPFNQYAHDNYRPKLTQRNKIWQLQDYSTNGRSLIHDSNSSIYFGGTPHWLIPNNGLKVWQQLSNDKINQLNKRCGLRQLGPSITRGGWYQPKGSLSAGGYSGMRYQRLRPYGWNVFVDYSTSARGPCSQDSPYVHSVQKATDIYRKSNWVSKIKMKDGVSLSIQRSFKSLRRTQTTLASISSDISYSRQEYIQSMDKDMLQPNLLVIIAAKSKLPMNLNIKLQLYDSYYQKMQYLLSRDNVSSVGLVVDTRVNDVYCNYHHIFSIVDKQNPIPTYDLSALPYVYRQGSSDLQSDINSLGNSNSPYLRLPLDSNWKLYWVMIPLKTFGVQRGINDVAFHAGRQLVNIDKFKLSLSVPKGSRNKQFYIDFVDAMLSQQLSYSNNTRQPITVSSTLFVGNRGTTRQQGRSYGWGQISQQDLIKRNRPPYFFKVKPQRNKRLINYSSSAIRNSIISLDDINDRNLVYVNNFRNSKLIYEVF